MSRFVDALITYRILRLLTTPFDQQDAFRLGLIDKRGNRLKRENELNTTEEQEAYSLLHRMVFRLKRIIEKVPMDNKNFLSFATAVALVREGIEYDDEILEEVFYMTQERQDVKDLAEELESGKMLSFKGFLEEKINMKSASMGDVITDFKKSDAPQFKGKSKEKRRQMAIAAKLANEEMGVAGGGVAGIGIPHPTKANQAEPGLTKGQQKRYKKKNKAGAPAVLIRRK
jgi:hypothetical protein